MKQFHAITIIGFLILTSNIIQGQKTKIDKVYGVEIEADEGIQNIGLLFGASGFHNASLELGIGFNFAKPDTVYDIPFRPFLGGALSAEKILGYRDLYCAKMDFWVDAVLTFGISPNIYFNKENTTVGIKPYVGFELYGINFTYGYNIFLTRNEIDELSRHIFSMRYYLTLMNIK